MSWNDAHNAPRFDLALSVFFPCYNEEGNVERLVDVTRRVLDELVADWEIIIVDDGSADATGRIADRLAGEDNRIRVVHHERNKGYGAALRSGFAAARKPYVFYTDGDGQFDVSELDRLLERVDEADIVSGYRRRRQDGPIRRFNSACWNLLVQHVLGFRCRDVDSAFKLYKREVLETCELKSDSALLDAELLARATRAGYVIRTLPVTHRPRIRGTQTGAKPGVIFQALRELLQLRRDIVRSRRTGQEADTDPRSA